MIFSGAVSVGAVFPLGGLGPVPFFLVEGSRLEVGVLHEVLVGFRGRCRGSLFPFKVFFVGACSVVDGGEGVGVFLSCGLSLVRAYSNLWVISGSGWSFFV